MERSSIQEGERVRGWQFPEPAEIVASLESFHAILWDALLYAQTKTNELVKGARNPATTKWFFSQAMRFYAQDIMFEGGLETRLVNDKDEDESASESEWDRQVLPSNGIAGKINGHSYRVLKVYDGGLPPAKTTARKQFYSQSHLLEGYQLRMLPNMEGRQLSLKPNLVYLWEIVGGQLRLYLAIPKHHSLFASTSRTLIPHPVTNIQPAEERSTADEVVKGAGSQ